MSQKKLLIGANSKKTNLSHSNMKLDDLIFKIQTLRDDGQIFEFDGQIVVEIGTNEKSQFYLSKKVEFLSELLFSLFPFAESFHFKLPVDLKIK